MRTCSPASDHNDLVFSLFMFDQLWFQEIVLLTFCSDIWTLRLCSWKPSTGHRTRPGLLGLCQPRAQWPSYQVSLTWFQANSTLGVDCPCLQAFSACVLSLEVLTFAHCDNSMWKQEIGWKKLLVTSNVQCPVV